MEKTHIDFNEYLNALAHIKIDPRRQCIEVVDIPKKEDEIMALRKNSKKHKNDENNRSIMLETMWKFMSMGKIDISYACVGYSFDGRPVLDYSAFIDLLVSYGFLINDALSFIDDFVECAKEDPKAPIVMTNINISKIMTEVKPLVGKDITKNKK